MQQEPTEARPPGSERYLTVRQAAQLLNLSRSMIYRLIKYRALPYIPIGASIRLRLSDLEAFMARPAAAARHTRRNALLRIRRRKLRRGRGSVDKSRPRQG